MRIKKMLTFGLVFSFSVFAADVDLASVTEEVKKTVDEVITIVSDKEMKKPANEQKRRSALKKAISAIFDYGEMAQRSMGRHWKERSATEKKEFVELFETLLENSYSGKIESY